MTFNAQYLWYGNNWCALKLLDTSVRIKLLAGRWHR